MQLSGLVEMSVCQRHFASYVAAEWFTIEQAIPKLIMWSRGGEGMTDEKLSELSDAIRAIVQNEKAQYALAPLRKLCSVAVNCGDLMVCTVCSTSKQV